MKIYASFFLLVTAFMAGCAAPRTAQPPPHPPAQMPAVPATEKETDSEELEKEIADYPLPDVRSEPALARYFSQMDSAHPSERPGVLLARAQKAIDEAQRLRRRKMGVWNILSIEDELYFVAYYKSAEEDCREILERWPGAPEAAEAQYTLGLIHDYPHMTEFQKADAEYLLTIERYPGTEAAAKAESGLRHLRLLLESPTTDVLPSP